MYILEILRGKILGLGLGFGFGYSDAFCWCFFYFWWSLADDGIGRITVDGRTHDVIMGIFCCTNFK